MIVKHHLVIVAVPELAGVAVAFSEILPVTVELLAGDVQVTDGPTFAVVIVQLAAVDSRPLESVTLTTKVQALFSQVVVSYARVSFLES